MSEVAVTYNNGDQTLNDVESLNRYVVMVVGESDFRLYLLRDVNANIYQFTEHLLRGGRDNLPVPDSTILKDSDESLHVDLAEQKLADYYGGVDGFIEIFHTSAHTVAGSSRFLGHGAFAYFDGETVDWIE